LFSLPAGTEMFHFPAFPPHALCVQAWVTGHDSCRVSPFGHPRIKARLTAPRGFSQPPTSFIGSWCQGIHRVPLLTWPQRCSRPLCSSQATGGPDLIQASRAHMRASFDEKSVRRAASPPAEAERARSVRGNIRSLRTQQRAWADPIRDFRSRLLETARASRSCTRRTVRSCRPTGQCSTP
jgi:hypothetical protein